MKKLVFMLAFALTLLYTGCTKQEAFVPSGGWLGNPNAKEIITFDDLRALSAKGDALTLKDLGEYRGMNFSNTMGAYNLVFGVEGGYRFQALAGVDGILTRTALESIWEDGGSGIDIRYGNVDEFLRTHPSNPALTIEEMKAAAEKYWGRTVTEITLEWWDYADEFPHHCKDPVKQGLSESLDSIEESKELFMDAEGRFIAVGKRYGTLYLPVSGADGEISYWEKVEN